MKNILLFLFLLVDTTGAEYLAEISLYQKDSYFKQTVYQEHTWQTFEQLKEAKQVVNPASYDLHLLNAAVFYATNKLRDKKGLDQLKFGAGLRDAAVLHTSQMVEKKFFDHFNNKNRKLRSPEDRIKLYVMEYSASGENVDYNYITLPSRTTYWQVAEAIIDDFLHSPPHKKIMLSKNLNHLGAAAQFEIKSKNGLHYYKATQDFSYQ